MSQTIYGIDFGTTNSCLAVLEPAGPRVIEIEGQATVPSVVSFDQSSGEVIVGQRARNRLLLRPEETVRSIKRQMGEAESLVIGGRSLLPEDIAAEILRYLKVEGEKALGQEIRQIVITVPAFFADAQRRATIRAGELAGLEVVRIINEPTAAALLYDRLERRGADRREAGSGERVLVYDLGGGTFDVSIVHISGELHEVLASCGDNQLGGDDFDHLLENYLSSGLDLADDEELSPVARARLREAAEKAKIDLSLNPFVQVTEEALVGDRHLDQELARLTFEELIAEHLEDTLEKVDEALTEARMDSAQIDRVVLVGGSTAIPRIHEMLARRFQCPVDHAIDPALCVALGAAVQGAILAGQIFDHILVDVAPYSLGLKTLGHEETLASLVSGPVKADTFSVLIRRNTQIPASFSEVFTTLVDHQEYVAVEVYQGESRRCSENTLIGEFPFDLHPAPRGAEVVAELSYDLDGIVRVRVEQRGFDNRREVTMNTRQTGKEAVSETALIDEEGAAVGGVAVDNYILRKAMAMAQEVPDGELRNRLLQAAETYAAALRHDVEDEVDAAEDALLEILEIAEELSEETTSEEMVAEGQ